MKNVGKIILILFIIIVVTIISFLFNNNWFLLLYTTILGFFPNEIKNFFYHLFSSKQIRISYSYLFRIEYNGNYLLVKDEQGRNTYHPVGGVYKFNPQQLDIAEKFEGRYDGLFNDSPDTQNDLRLIISKKKYKNFKNWFKTGLSREYINNLSREFREELIDRNILSTNEFKNINYKYIGSFTKKDINSSLKMKQIHHYDIINLKLTKHQKEVLSKLIITPSDSYLFASENNIKAGFVQFGGRRYDIEKYTELILIENTYKYKKEIRENTDFNCKVS